MITTMKRIVRNDQEVHEMNMSLTWNQFQMDIKDGETDCPDR